MMKRGVLLLGATMLALSAGVSSSAELNSKAVTFTLPEKINWIAPPGSTGVQQAIMVGDPSKPGFYAMLTKWLPGNMSHPHFHPNDRFITVIKGTWWVGTGTKFDPDSTVPMPAGTFVTHLGKGIHYDGAKTEETIILIVGDGPAGYTAAEEK